ncbi:MULTISPECIES: sialidase family protein [unclassified Micromonospora]|uniref:sialidase family protein n=1 Tax=unclassified Micromonospora TaxID=2617518 RepID=UPI0033302FAF
MIEKHFVVRDVPGQCHGSTVCQAGGAFVVAWFQGDHEGAANSRIWLSRGAGGDWSAPVVVSGDLAPCWNPVLHPQDSGALLLFFKVGATISSWRTFLATSLDGGRTWSAPQPLLPDDVGGRGPVRTPPVRLRSGRLLAGASTETWGAAPRWDSFVDISDDDGRSWRRTQDIAIDHDTFPGAGIIQPTLWQNPAGEVRLLARSTAGRLVSSTSADDGETWPAGALSSVPNNNSGVSACAVDEVVYLAHNPASGDWASRAPLLVSRSFDDGASWQPWATLEESLESTGGEGYQPADSGVVTTGVNEFSYPCLVRTPDGLAVTYTWQRRGIVLATLTPSNRSNL